MKEVEVFVDGDAKTGDYLIVKVADKLDMWRGNWFEELGPGTGMTKNYFDYHTILRALKEMVILGIDSFTVRLSSKLLSKQLNGVFAVKAPDLIPLYGKVDEVITRLRLDVRFVLVERKGNLAWRTRLGKKVDVPLDLFTGGDLGEKVLSIVGDLDDGKGAPWDKIIAEAKSQGISKGNFEEAINSLMDAGEVYEPVLGRLRVL